MKRVPIFLAILCVLSACHKESPAKKIVDGLPVSNMPVTSPPAQAMQQYLLLKNAAMNPVITNLNRLSQKLPASGLNGPDGSMNYTFQRSEKHYGSATFTIQFRDAGNGAIDPFTSASSSTSVKSVHIGVASNSAQFAIAEDLSLALDTVGLLTGPYNITGTSNFNGSSYSIVFNIPSPVNATISGLLNGSATLAGTGPNAQPTSSLFTFGLESDLSGFLTWEGQTAGIHIAADGSGYLTTNDSRILFQ